LVAATLVILSLMSAWAPWHIVLIQAAAAAAAAWAAAAVLETAETMAAAVLEAP
jgi:hypothetical protein